MVDTVESRAAVRSEVRALIVQLGRVAAKLATIEHGAACEIDKARADLFEAHSMLRLPAGAVS